VSRIARRREEELLRRLRVRAGAGDEERAKIEKDWHAETAAGAARNGGDRNG